MPYITEERRVGLREHVDAIIDCLAPMEEDHVKQYQYFAYNRAVEAIIYGCCMPYGPALEDPWYPSLMEIHKELKARKARGDDTGGDSNYCISRLLVGLTRIHHHPAYGSKIQWIQERVTNTAFNCQSCLPKPLGILQCVSLELYIRFGVPYEEKKRVENGDIMM